LRTIQFLFVVIIGTVLAIGPPTEFLAGDAGATRMAIAGVAAVFAVLSVRVARLAVVLYHDRLVIGNLFRSYQVSRADIVGVDPAPAYGRMWKTGLLIQLSGGKRLSASAFARTPVDSDGAVVYAKLITTWLATGIVPEPGSPRHSREHRRPQRPTFWGAWLALLRLVVAFAALTVLDAIINPTSGG
jgi:hypothetical protein